MARLVRTARGEQIDFDMVIIKQQLAEAPMNVEVTRRKEFIDLKEGKPRGQRSETITPVVDEFQEEDQDDVELEQIEDDQETTE